MTTINKTKLKEALLCTLANYIVNNDKEREDYEAWCEENDTLIDHFYHNAGDLRKGQIIGGHIYAAAKLYFELTAME